MMSLWYTGSEDVISQLTLEGAATCFSAWAVVVGFVVASAWLLVFVRLPDGSSGDEVKVIGPGPHTIVTA